MKKTSTKKDLRSFETYEEAMKKIFPYAWKEEGKRREDEKRKKMPMDELAKSIMGAF